MAVPVRRIDIEILGVKGVVEILLSPGKINPSPGIFFPEKGFKPTVWEPLVH